MTVSTGVLAAHDINFNPVLPVDQQEAIASLPLGCYNNFAMLYEEGWPFGPDTPERIDYSNGNDINFALKLNVRAGRIFIVRSPADRPSGWKDNPSPNRRIC